MRNWVKDLQFFNWKNCVWEVKITVKCIGNSQIFKLFYGSLTVSQTIRKFSEFVIFYIFKNGRNDKIEEIVEKLVSGVGKKHCVNFYTFSVEKSVIFLSSLIKNFWCGFPSLKKIRGILCCWHFLNNPFFWFWFRKKSTFQWLKVLIMLLKLNILFLFRVWKKHFENFHRFPMIN